MLKLRVISAVLLLAVFLAALFANYAWAFIALAAVILSLAAWEWGRLSGLTGLFQRSLFMVFFFAACAIILLTSNLFQPSYVIGLPVFEHNSFFYLGAFFWLLISFVISRFTRTRSFLANSIVRSLSGLILLCSSWAALLHLRFQPDGQWLILYVVAVVAFADIGAYFSGKQFGAHKLAPNLSPGKTWEGFAGGVLAVLVLALVTSLASDLFISDSLPVFLLISVLVGVQSVFGDLFESAVKRIEGVKDSGKILPGHGGAMDRVDALTAALPLFCLLTVLL